jgi:acetyl-CoA acyltransferase
VREVVVVDVVRTAGGKRNGVLSGWHPVDLGAHVLRALVQRNLLDPVMVDDVYLGCVSQVGAQSLNLGRSVVLAAGFPESVPATTIDRQCGSSQQAIHFAAATIAAGHNDIVIAAGVECMTQVPLGASMALQEDVGLPFGPTVGLRYADQGGLVPQGVSGELIAQKWGHTRDQLDAFALQSQTRAAAAADAGYFEREIVATQKRTRDKETKAIVEHDELVTRDEGIRPTTLEGLAALKPAFLPEGVLTAGTSSQITDGASAALLMTVERAQQLGLRPRARFVDFAVSGVDPIMMLTGVIPATQSVLERAKMTLDQIDLVEINEAFASVVLAWQSELQADLENVNVNGGAIALGHPVGASGTKLLATLMSELERRGKRYGLQTMCEGGGMANAMIIERL